MPGQQTVVVAFTWDGQQQAQLYYVIDNGKSKIVATDGLKGKGKVSATFTMPASATHDLQWSLWFPGKTLKNLALTTSVDGDERDGNPASGLATNGAQAQIELRLIADGELAVPRWAASRERELFARAFHRELCVVA